MRLLYLRKLSTVVTSSLFCLYLTLGPLFYTSVQAYPGSFSYNRSNTPPSFTVFLRVWQTSSRQWGISETEISALKTAISSNQVFQNNFKFSSSPSTDEGNTGNYDITIPIGLSLDSFGPVYSAPNSRYAWEAAKKLYQLVKDGGSQTNSPTDVSEADTMINRINKVTSTFYGYNGDKFDVYFRPDAISEEDYQKIKLPSAWVERVTTIDERGVEDSWNHEMLPQNLNSSVVGTISTNEQYQSWKVVQRIYQLIQSRPISEDNASYYSTIAGDSAAAIQQQLDIYESSGNSNFGDKMFLTPERTSLDANNAGDAMSIGVQIKDVTDQDFPSTDGTTYKCIVYYYKLPVSSGITETASLWQNIGESEISGCRAGFNAAWTPYNDLIPDSNPEISGGYRNNQQYLIRAKLLKFPPSGNPVLLGKKEITISTRDSGTAPPVNNIDSVSINASTSINLGESANIKVSYSPNLGSVPPGGASPQGYIDAFITIRLYISKDDQIGASNWSLKKEFSTIDFVDGPASYDWATTEGSTTAGNHYIEVRVVDTKIQGDNGGNETLALRGKSQTLINVIGRPQGPDTPTPQDPVQPVDGDSLTEGSGGSNIAHFSGLFSKIVTFFSEAVAALAFFGVIVGGFQYMTAAGNTQQADKAKRTILYSIVGIIVAALSFAIENIVANLLH